MAQRTCESCSVVFMPGHGNRRNCFECSPRRMREYTPKPRTLIPFECAECGAVGAARNANRRYCDATCRKAAEHKRYGRPCSVCGDLRYSSATSRRGLNGVEPICQPCRREMHGSGAYSRGCRCDVCKAGNNEQNRLYRIKRRESGNPIRRVAPRAPRPVMSRECVHCGEAFETKDSRARACSARCGLYAYHGFSSSRELVPVVWPARSTVAPVNVVRGGVWWSGFVYGPCHWCGDAFMSPTTTFRNKYCSKRCGRRAGSAAYRASRGDFWISARNRLAIYERDGWTCQLCFESIDRDAHYSTDWAPTLDHIEPQAATLIPDHSAENLRLCHRWCNAVRGDGTYNVDFFEGVA